MLAKVLSGGVVGVDGFIVTVECDTGPGLNSYEVVGLAEAAVRESRVRIRSALGNSGYESKFGAHCFRLTSVTSQGNVAP